VRVAATTADGNIRLEVSDNGPGLPPKARDKLFMPFTGSARAGGTGLGLAIVRDVVQAHGGQITLAVNTPQGATFRIELQGAVARVRIAG
jgi:signal transduction histidine kinase